MGYFYKHEDGGKPQECEQCHKIRPVSFTHCCGMLVCDECRHNHTDDDCVIEDDDEQYSGQ